MKKLIRILSVALCLALCLGIAALASGEASGGASGDAYVASSDGGSVIEYGYAGTGTDLTASGAVAAAGDETVIEKQAIISVGNSAVTVNGSNSLVLRDCVVIGIDPAPTAPLSGMPGNLLVAGNVRATLALSQSQEFYINSTVLSTNWGALSTDGAVPATEEGQKDLSVYTYGTLAHAIEGGYGSYSDLFCHVYFYGSDLESAEIGIISGTYGEVVAGTIGDGEADPYMGAKLTDADKASQPDKDKGSIISGGRNAIMVHSVSLPPYWEYEGYSQEELPLYVASISVHGSVLRTDKSLNMGVLYDDQKQAYIDHTDGTVILIKSTNTDIRLDSAELLPAPDGTGAIIQTVYNNDNMFMNAVPDGEQYPGVGITMTDMDVAGDVLHEDYQRDMNLTLSGTSLTGAVNAFDCDHWNEVAAAEGFSDYALDASYETPHGVNLTLENGSVWTVTGESTLTSLTIDSTSSINGTMTVDGAATPIAAGTYTGAIVLTP